MTVTATSVSVWWIIIFFWTQITQIQNKTTWYNRTEMLWATRHIVIALHPKLCGLVGLGPPSWGGYNTSTGSTLLIQKSAPGLLTPCCSWQEQHGAKIHTLYWTQSILGVVFSPHPLDHLSACSRKFVSFVRSGTGWGRGWSAGVVENQQFIYVQWLLTLSSDLEPEKDASFHLTSCPARKVITSHWPRVILCLRDAP